MDPLGGLGIVATLVIIAIMQITVVTVIVLLRGVRVKVVLLMVISGAAASGSADFKVCPIVNSSAVLSSRVLLNQSL